MVVACKIQQIAGKGVSTDGAEAAIVAAYTGIAEPAKFGGTSYGTVRDPQPHIRGGVGGTHDHFAIESSNNLIGVLEATDPGISKASQFSRAGSRAVGDPKALREAIVVGVIRGEYCLIAERRYAVPV